MEKLTTNKIEEILLKKKQNEYVQNIKKAVVNLCDAINCGQDIKSTEDDEDFKKWVMGLIRFGLSGVYSSDLYTNKLPECINKALLKNAVVEFIQSVESTKEIIDSL